MMRAGRILSVPIPRVGCNVKGTALGHGRIASYFANSSSLVRHTTNQ
jgi:hypothetical protein